MHAVHYLLVAFADARDHLSSVAAPDGHTRVFATAQDELLLGTAETAAKYVHALLVTAFVLADEFCLLGLRVS